MKSVSRRIVAVAPLALLAGCIFDAGSGADTAGADHVGAETPGPDTPAAVSTIAYITGVAGNLTAYTIDPVNGGLTQIGDPAAAGRGPHQVAITPSRKYAYVADDAGSALGRIRAYELESAHGAPIAIPGGTSAVEVPGCVAVHPSGNFLFAVEVLNDDLDMFRIDPATGLLSVTGSINDTGGENPNYIAVRPDGKFAYMVNVTDASADVFSFDETTGTLSRLPGLHIAVSAGSPVVIKIDPAGRFAFTGNTGASGDSVSAFAIDSLTGALTPAGAQPTGRSPADLAVAPSGEFIYVANADDNSVSAYTMAGGTLAAIGSVPTGNSPSGIAVDPSGRFVYVVNELDHTISVFDVDTGTGALAVRGTPLALPRPDGPNSIVVIPSAS